MIASFATTYQMNRSKNHHLANHQSRKAITPKINKQKSSLSKRQNQKKTKYKKHKKGTLFSVKYNPPYIDRNGNIYNDRETLSRALGLSENKRNTDLSKGRIGHNGNPPTKPKAKQGRPLKYQPPYIDPNGKQYQSKRQIQRELGLTKRQIWERLLKGTIGHNGKEPSKSGVSKKCTDGNNAYPSVRELAKAHGINIGTASRYINGYKYPNWQYL